jgi:Flp pilus assembly protein TadD
LQSPGRGFLALTPFSTYQRALDEIEIAKRGLPNEAEAYKAIGAIQRHQGKWADSTANFQKAVALDPRNAFLLLNLAFSYIAQRNFEAADKAVSLPSAPISQQKDSALAQLVSVSGGNCFTR